MARQEKEIEIGVPKEIASGVYWMEAGKGLMRSNVYFVRSGRSWTLIDAASAKCGRSIQKAAESLFGTNPRPDSILLTHYHPDHAGSALELAQAWRCPVYVHTDELPLTAEDISAVKEYSNPLDRWIVLPLLRVMPPRKVQAILAQGSIKAVARALDPSAGVPGLPDWECIHAPGHTPGHVAYFRPGDRVLITGDAIVTVNLNSLSGLLLHKQRLSGPPRYTTWSWPAAKGSAALLAQLEPRVLAGGHGAPIAGPTTALDVQASLGAEGPRGAQGRRPLEL